MSSSTYPIASILSVSHHPLSSAFTIEKLVVVVSVLSPMSLELSSGQVEKFESEASRDVGGGLDDGESAV